MFREQNQPGSVCLALLEKAGYREPTPLQKKVFPLSLRGKSLFIEAAKGKGRTLSYLITLLLKLAKDQPKTRALVVVSSHDTLSKVEREFRRLKHSFSNNFSLYPLGNKNDPKQEAHTLRNNPDVIIGTADRIIDHIRRNNLNLSEIQIAVVDISGSYIDEGFIKDSTFIFSKLPKKQQTLIYSPRYDASLYSLSQKACLIGESDLEQGSEIENLYKEEKKMSSEKDSSKHEIERAKEIFSSLIKTIREEEDPDELNKFRKLFRKNVPLPLRSYVAAYFFKESYFKKGKERVTGKKPFNGRENLKTLFVNIGKNRRVYAKDLYKHFASAPGIDQSNIKNVKVMDNYSFVDISDSLARKAIDSLNGKEFRGKKLTVNFARNKSQ